MLEFEIDLGAGASAGVVSDASKCQDVILPQQTHSCNVALIGHDGALPNLKETDALISLHRGLKIGVRTADCVPVLVYCSDIRAVAAIHAGWKGSLGRIVESTLMKLQTLGADLSKARSALGPGICGGCYEISEELAQIFARAGFADCFTTPRHLDLPMANRKQLINKGVPNQSIEMSRYCTLETYDLPSWRRGPTQQRLISWIALDK